MSTELFEIVNAAGLIAVGFAGAMFFVVLADAKADLYKRTMALFMIGVVLLALARLM